MQFCWSSRRVELSVRGYCCRCAMYSSPGPEACASSRSLGHRDAFGDLCFVRCGRFGGYSCWVAIDDKPAASGSRLGAADRCVVCDELILHGGGYDAARLRFAR